MGEKRIQIRSEIPEMAADNTVPGSVCVKSQGVAFLKDNVCEILLSGFPARKVNAASVYVKAFGSKAKHGQFHGQEAWPAAKFGNG